MEGSGGGGRFFFLSPILVANLALGDVAIRRRLLPSLAQPFGAGVCLVSVNNIDGIAAPLSPPPSLPSLFTWSGCDANGVPIVKKNVPSLECPFPSLRPGWGHALASRGPHHVAGGGACVVAVVVEGVDVGGVVVVFVFGHPFG